MKVFRFLEGSIIKHFTNINQRRGHTKEIRGMENDQISREVVPEINHGEPDSSQGQMEGCCPVFTRDCIASAFLVS